MAPPLKAKVAKLLEQAQALAMTQGQSSLLRYQKAPIRYMREVLGVDPWAKQREIARLLLTPPYKVLVKASHGVGKCVDGREVMTLADGSRIQATDLIGKEFSLLTLVEGKPTAVWAKAERNRIEPVYRITTSSGKTIVRNAEHPLWVADGVFVNARKPKITPRGWTPTANIVVGQAVAVAEELPAFGDELMPDEEIKVLAYLIGDGGYTNGGIIFSQSDNKQLVEFRACTETMGASMRHLPGTYDYTVKIGVAGGRIYKTASGPVSHGVNPIRQSLRRHGLVGKHSRDKRIPPAIFRLSREKMALFLSRLYATDGWACETGRRGEIGYCSTSEGLVRDIQELLGRFGIHGTMFERTKVKAWVFNILTARDILLFAERIGIYGNEAGLGRAVAKAKLATRQGRRWRWDQAPQGTRWERVKSVELLPDADTVAIEVPEHHTYLTQFWEHNTWVSGALTSWWYDTHPEESSVITTAPTSRDVKDLLWMEVRRQRAAAGGRVPMDFIGDKAPEMGTSGTHYAKGFTANTGESFVGRHFRWMLFIFDEAIGVHPIFWETTKSMFQGSGEHAWLAIFNPTDTASQPYIEEMERGLDGKPAWHVVSMSAMDHPNVIATLAGLPQPYPGAVSLAQVDTWVAEWCEPIGADEVDAAQGDFEWRPGSGSWRRPGPLFDSRACGRWPRQGSYGVWSDLAWTLVTTPAEQVIAAGELPVIGADLASTGGDFSEFHTRHGTHSLAHERHNGWTEDQIAGRLKVLCGELAALVNAKLPAGKAPVKPQDIPVHYDADGRGGALASHKGDYKFVPIHASSAARAAGKFPNRRSELWFGTVMLARGGQVNLSRLDRDSQNRLRQEAMSPRWKLDAAGRQVVEKKDETKRRLKKSPDGMDAVNLAYVRPGDWQVPTSAAAPEMPSKGRRMGDEQMARGTRGRGLFGR